MGSELYQRATNALHSFALRGAALYQRTTKALRGFSLLAACVFVFALACSLLGEGSEAKIILLTFGLAKITAGAFAGYWADRALFPYARPHEYAAPFDQTEDELQRSAYLFALACIRRVLLVCACVIALGMIA